MMAEIDRISQVTQFNGVTVLNGSAGTITFQVTPTAQGQSVSPSCVQVSGTGRVAVAKGAC